MTVEQYYAAVARLNLRPSSVPHVYLVPDGTPYNVKDALSQTPEQRAETIERLTLAVRGF
jgi:hypothetical protein